MTPRGMPLGPALLAVVLVVGGVPPVTPRAAAQTPIQEMLAPGPAAGQEEPDTAGEPQAPPDPGTLGVFEAAARARILADSAARAERTVARLGNVEGFAAELEAATERHGELRALLGSMIETDFVRLERLSRVRDQALLEDARLEAVQGRLIDRLGQLGDLRARWVGHQQEWRRYRADLRGDPDLPAVGPDIDAALTRIDTLVARSGRAATSLLALQRRTEELRADMEQISVVVTAIRTGRQRALTQRVEPVLLSGGHRAQLATGEWRAWNPIDAIQPAAYPAFVREHLGLLLFQVLLAIVLGLAAK